MWAVLGAFTVARLMVSRPYPRLTKQILPAGSLSHIVQVILAAFIIYLFSEGRGPALGLRAGHANLVDVAA